MLRLTVDEFDDLDDVEQFEPVQPPGDDGGIGSIIGGLGDGVNAPPGGVSYMSDPWGNTFEMLRDAAAGLSGDVLPALSEATLPDLSAQWFIDAYRVSFATAVFVAVALLFPQFIRTARGRQSGRELVDSLGLYFGAFLLGATFGPAAGIMLVSFFHSLSDVFVDWGVQDSVGTVSDRFQDMITGAEPDRIAGGMPIAVISDVPSAQYRIMLTDAGAIRMRCHCDAGAPKAVPITDRSATACETTTTVLPRLLAMRSSIAPARRCPVWAIDSPPGIAKVPVSCQSRS